MAFKNKGGGADSGAEFAPALDSDPVYERTAVDRWGIAPKAEPFEPGTASGPWADSMSEFDLEPPPGPGFLDPGTHALENHVAPMMASDSLSAGALAGASADLSTPMHGGGGGGGGKGKPPPTDLW
jgi:hypothetical protein